MSRISHTYQSTHLSDLCPRCRLRTIYGTYVSLKVDADLERLSDLHLWHDFAANRKASSKNWKASSENGKVSAEDMEGFF